MRIIPAVTARAFAAHAARLIAADAARLVAADAARLVAASAAVLLAACAANPSPVHVVGTSSEMTVLTGSWTGEYSSVETGRSGSIEFTLTAGTDTAFGDVVMVPRALAPTPSDPRTTVGATAPTPQVLQIAFVRVASNVVSGTLNPYKSPDCGCTLTTVFRGTITSNRIEGTFTTAHSDAMAPQQKGTWWVTRKGAAK